MLAEGRLVLRGFPYTVAGIQTLINTVRATGAHCVIMADGLDYANDLTEWLTYEPKDPDHNLVASWHSYNFDPCSTPVLDQRGRTGGRQGPPDRRRDRRERLRR
jgi:Cellulase (glycosyl hydrolase family 5)